MNTTVNLPGERKVDLSSAPLHRTDYLRTLSRFLTKETMKLFTGACNQHESFAGRSGLDFWLRQRSFAEHVEAFLERIGRSGSSRMAPMLRDIHHSDPGEPQMTLLPQERGGSGEQPESETTEESSLVSVPQPQASESSKPTLTKSWHCFKRRLSPGRQTFKYPQPLAIRPRTFNYPQPLSIRARPPPANASRARKPWLYLKRIVNRMKDKWRGDTMREPAGSNVRGGQHGRGQDSSSFELI